MPSTEETKRHEEDLQNLKKHILSCPDVDSKSKATVMLIECVDKELSKLDRDKKLHKKFSNIPKSSSSNNNVDDVKAIDDDIVKVASPNRKENKEEEEDMEWQDINTTVDNDHHNGIRGKVLSEITINKMSSNNIKVKSHISAIGVAIHGVLLHLGFTCTGIPPKENKSGGFAPAVRDLPKHLYLPYGWDSDQSIVRLRYRKADLGTRILRIVQNESNISIYFHATDTKEGEYNTPVLSFSTSDYINIYSFQSAFDKSKSMGISPTLHYKSLSVLINTFCNTFDLGDCTDDKNTTSAHYSFQRNIQYSEAYTNRALCSSPNPLERNNQRYTDFESDLTPPCLRVDPSIMDPLRQAEPTSTGNLMGPNHPMFHQDEFDLYNGSRPNFAGMQPRFDPYGPPSLFSPSNRGGSRGGRGRVPHTVPGGDPNPDHLKPPNDFDPGDMYL